MKKTMKKERMGKKILKGWVDPTCTPIHLV
jgi:hypothetical protein